MDIKQIILLSVLYYWASSTALSLGVGYYTMYRPVIAGCLTGLVLGEPFTGMMAGAVVNIIYIDFVSTGGSLEGDQCLTAMIAALMAVLFGLSPVEASAAAYPFGFLGILIWKYRLNINSVFVKKYEKKFAEGMNPHIGIYDGLLPQLLLFIMSAAVILVTVFVTLLLRKFIINIKYVLFLAGIFLVFSSTWNILYKLQSKKGYLIFAMSLTTALLVNPSSYIIFLIVSAIILLLSNKKMKLILNSKDYETHGKNGKIRKRDLIYSWFVWMNFSHSCYSYERLQGMAFAHSMRNVFKRLYTGEEEIAGAIHRHSEIFNTEPNMGTPIHGYIISLEESKQKNKIADENTDDIMFIKKGMMGIAAGLGDSYTQVVLTPLFILMSVMLCFDNKFIMALVPVMILASVILIISYTGFMKGYYEGRNSLIERVNIVKNSRIKTYFPYIFSGILGVSLGKLLIIMFSGTSENLTIYITVGIISMVYTIVKIKRRN
jgi:PTS system mannose-specific IID component